VSGAVFKVRPHPIIGFPVRANATVALAAAHQIFRSDRQRFVDVDFLPSVDAPNFTCRSLDHFYPQ
jgi:hypothetical protein